MVLPVIIAGQAIAHGLRIAGLRILPYIIRSKTARAASQYVTKKVGQKSITETGYVIITKDPTKFKLAQKIFGKSRVFRNESILQAQSTASKEIVPLSQKILKSASPEVRTTILKQADDAANGVSKFISSSKVQTVGGTKVSKPFTDFFGKNLKFSDKTIEAIKKAEMGPTSLSKEVATFVPKTTKWVKSPTQSTSAQAAKEATKKKIQEFKGTKLAEETKNLPIKQIVKTEKRPWYVNIMPKYLRTTKDVRITGPEKIPYTGSPYQIRTVTEGVAKGRLAGTVAGAGTAMYGYGKITGPDKSPVQTDKGIEIDISELFGGEPEIYKQKELTSGIDFYDTDEAGNVIQAQ
ncbi:MAG: hypothetical protein H8D84_00935 [Proteobacteria bacterium]|nr:hypothetical protein [Pseudomonadota bacterium]